MREIAVDTCPAGTPRPAPPTPQQRCSIRGCPRAPSGHRGWCWAHYHRYIRHGDPLAGGTYQGEPRACFEEAMLLVTDDCIEVRHGTSLCIDGRNRSAAAWACERIYGPPPAGTFATHGPCHNPRCINARAGHVTWGTPQANNLDRLRDGTWHPALGPSDPWEIAELHGRGDWSVRELAAAFDVGTQIIESVIARRNALVQPDGWKPSRRVPPPLLPVIIEIEVE